MAGRHFIIQSHPHPLQRVERALPTVDCVISAAFSCWPRLKYKHTERPVKADSFPYNVKPESPKSLPLKRPRFPFTQRRQTLRESDTLFLQWGESRLEQGSQGPMVVMGGLPGQPLPTKQSTLPLCEPFPDFKQPLPSPESILVPRILWDSGSLCGQKVLNKNIWSLGCDSMAVPERVWVILIC